MKKKLHLREREGRPRIEDDEPELLKTITDIAIYGSAADDRRRTETIRNVKTLNELTETLHSFGFNISRSGLYLRLIPRRTDSEEGKRHISTVPVRLIKAQNETHSKHMDTCFASATIHNLESLASVLGPKQVFFISQDDKARVPIGITAVNKQAPLLMHLDYRVTLPDHDWIVAPSHKLIPSVYAGINIDQNKFGNCGAVTYSGPTYVAIRSGKHSSSTAYSHVVDIERIFKLPEFDNLIKITNDEGVNLVKPIGIFSVDGGPDENPRYAKVIQSSIHHFISNDLDALYIACNAPGRSAFNRVERRMAPLSKELAGVVLPHAHYGTHLNNHGQTVDIEKEKENFKFAGETLSKIWSNMVLDGFPVVSEFVKPEISQVEESYLVKRPMEWQSKHIQSSQYCLQIVKCMDKECCSPFRSCLLKILPDRFLPPPAPILQSNKGLCIDASGKFPSLFITIALQHTLYPEIFKEFKQIPYDIMCPSVKSNISRKICAKCGLYNASLSYLKQHLKQCGVMIQESKVRPVRIAAKRQRELLAIMCNIENQEDAEWLEEEFLNENTELPNFKNHNMQAPITSINTHLKSIWEEDKKLF